VFSGCTYPSIGKRGGGYQGVYIYNRVLHYAFTWLISWPRVCIALWGEGASTVHIAYAPKSCKAKQPRTILIAPRAGRFYIGALQARHGSTETDESLTSGKEAAVLQRITLLGDPGHASYLSGQWLQKLAVCFWIKNTASINPCLTTIKKNRLLSEGSKVTLKLVFKPGHTFFYSVATK